MYGNSNRSGNQQGPLVPHGAAVYIAISTSLPPVKMTIFILRLLVVNMAVEKFKFVCYTYSVTKSRLVQRSSTYEKKCFVSYLYRYRNRFADSGDIYKGLDFLSAHCLSCVCSINNRKQKKKAEINSNPALVPAVMLPDMTAFLLPRLMRCGAGFVRLPDLEIR